MSDQLLPLEAVKERTGFGSTWIYERIKEGKFPKPIKFSPRCVRWRASDIDAWMASLQPQS